MIRFAQLLPLPLALAAVMPVAQGATPDLTTLSERSGFQATGRYEEVVVLCAAFQKAYPKQVRCTEFGRTPEGRPMLALVVNRGGAFTPAQAKARGLPVLLVQGGIHAGEIDGKDAGFLALREALENRAASAALDKQVLIFVPVFNVDGHERFGKWNRPNQRGPVEMGWRTSGQNYNLNRDYVKAETPEMQAMLALVNAWDPLAYIDLHVTDGAKFEHDVSIQVEPVHAGDAALRTAGVALRDGVIADLTRQGSLPQPFYMAFAENDDPASGFVDGVADPRFSTGYFQLRNRMAMLVETHSWKDYPTRVRITHNAVVSVMTLIAQHGAAWNRAAHEADVRAQSLAGSPVALNYKASDKVRTVAFRGYAYTRTPSDVSGALMTHYDETRPQIWNVPLRDDVGPDLSVSAPGAGYVIPAAFAQQTARRLALHGISYRSIASAHDMAAVETFRADKASFAAGSFEGHQRLTLQGQWKAETRAIGKGALFVPIAQAKARLVMALLEPQAPDSMAAWGMFNAAFERKEYMEDYVAEDVAREQLAASAALAAEFKARLASDPKFAASAAARLEFFERRHSSWDERFNLYPVMRVPMAP
ncbi:MAG: M14 family metallopeptidase [Pseudomonadota bacterium]